MKKTKKFLITICICICLCMISTIVLADVGSFEDYGGGWDSGSSWDSWDSGSSWDSGGYDHSYSSGGGIYFFDGPIGIIIFIIFVIIYIYAQTKNKSNNQRYRTQHNTTTSPAQIQQLEIRQRQIENKIQENDPDFNKEELIAWSKNLFVKLQQAWTQRDWETIRTFETESLFEQHKNQLQGYINNKQINVMDRICVNYAHLYNYTIEGDKEILTVRLNSRMADYIIDEETKQVLKGDKLTERVNTYLLTFIRKNGIKTKPGSMEVNTTNCPNCGAPTKITSSGKCEYCGSVMTTGEYNWVLSNLERENIRY